VWHEYTRKGRTKQWDDDKNWVSKNVDCHKRNRKLFEMDGEVKDIDFGEFDFGKERTLNDYEKYSGLSFSKRGVQQYTLDNNLAPNPVIEDPEQYEESFLTIFKHCIDIVPGQVPLDDYDFWVVAFENDKGDTIFRQDADTSEIQRLKNDPDGYYKIWRTFNIKDKPHKWVVWPHSISKDWCERLTGNL
jgi:hypothetical protein